MVYGDHLESSFPGGNGPNTTILSSAEALFDRNSNEDRRRKS